MTPSTLAETILRDVKRYSLNMLAIEMYETPHGGWVKLPAVEAALSRALDLALAERAGELAQSDDPKVMLYHGEYVEALRSLLAQNAALLAERDASNELGRAFEEDAGQQRARAEAAEAREERLRGALERIKADDQHQSEWRYWEKEDGYFAKIARAALTETATTEEGK